MRHRWSRWAISLGFLLSLPASRTGAVSQWPPRPRSAARGGQSHARTTPGAGGQITPGRGVADQAWRVCGQAEHKLWKEGGGKVLAHRSKARCVGRLRPLYELDATELRTRTRARRASRGRAQAISGLHAHREAPLSLIRTSASPFCAARPLQQDPF